MVKSISWIEALLNWFEKNARYMPWREEQSPYRTWISEIMLQQTQVDTVIDYFNRFVARFPNVEALAAADPQDVLKQWEGLGYYTRAHNLMKCAKVLKDKYGGIFPQTYAELIELPGIGPYTAAAIASIAFKEAIPVVDGNVLRVYARLFCMSHNIKSNTAKELVFEALKTPIIESNNPSFFNQGMMELGALICRPQSPSCEICPLKTTCCAYRKKNVDAFPVVEKKAPSPHKEAIVHLIEKEGKFLLRKRSEKLWHNLWIFPQFLESEVCDLKVTQTENLHHIVHHVFTHFSLDMHLHKTNINNDIPEGYNYFTLEEIQHLPLPVPHRKIVNLISKILKREKKK